MLTRARKRRKHRPAWRRGRGARRAGRHPKKVLYDGRLCGQYMRTTIVSQGTEPDRAGDSDPSRAPKFLDGSMSLGQVMQAASAFTIVQSAFGWLVDNYPRLADWTACARRIASLMVSLDALERRNGRRGRPHQTRRDDGGAVLRLHIFRSRSMTARPSSTRPKLPSIPESACWWPENPAPARARWCGPSPACGRGVKGKSIKSRWLFMLPQRPYVPPGTLRRAAAYPAAAEDWTPEEIADALDDAWASWLAEEEAPGIRHCLGVKSSASPSPAPPA